MKVKVKVGASYIGRLITLGTEGRWILNETTIAESGKRNTKCYNFEILSLSYFHRYRPAPPAQLLQVTRFNSINLSVLYGETDGRTTCLIVLPAYLVLKNRLCSLKSQSNRTQIPKAHSVLLNPILQLLCAYLPAHP